MAASACRPSTGRLATGAQRPLLLPATAALVALLALCCATAVSAAAPYTITTVPASQLVDVDQFNFTRHDWRSEKTGHC
jgi:hypothetical protein